MEDDSLVQADVAATVHFPEDRLLITLGVQGVREEVTVTDKNLSDPYDKDSDIMIVPTLRRGNAAGDAPASRIAGEIIMPEAAAEALKR